MDEPAASSHEVSAKNQLRSPLGRFVKTVNDSVGEELIDVKVHNPLKKIYGLLEQIKQHQETTFAFRLSVPLLALPLICAVILGFGGFQLGRLNPICQPQFATRIGMFYVVKQLKPVDKNPLLTFVPPVSQPSPVTAMQALLRDENTVYQITLMFPLASENYYGRKLAVSGNLNSCTQTLTVSSPVNLTVLPE